MFLYKHKLSLKKVATTVFDHSNPLTSSLKFKSLGCQWNLNLANGTLTNTY